MCVQIRYLSVFILNLPPARRKLRIAAFLDNPTQIFVFGKIHSYVFCVGVKIFELSEVLFVFFRRNEGHLLWLGITLQAFDIAHLVDIAHVVDIAHIVDIVFVADAVSNQTIVVKSWFLLSFLFDHTQQMFHLQNI